MNISQERKPPVEFITVGEEYDSISVDSNSSFQITSEPYYRLGGPHCKQSLITQPNPLYRTNRDDDVSVSYSACLPPSLSRTCNSFDDDDDDDDDSSSIDLIAEMISNDELSIDLGDSALFETEKKNLSYGEYTHISPSFTHPIAENDDRPSRPRRIDDMKNRLRSLEINYRRQKIEISSRIQSARSPIAVATNILRSPISKSPPSDQRIDDMKNKLRLFEDRYEEYRCGSSENDSVARRTDIIVATGARKLNRRNKLVPSDRRSYDPKTAMMNSILETIGAAICIGVILGFFYFIFVLYKMSISTVIQDNNVRFSFAL